MIVNDPDPAVARLKTLALQAKQQGDIAKAKEYLIQLRVYSSCLIRLFLYFQIHRHYKVSFCTTRNV